MMEGKPRTAQMECTSNDRQNKGCGYTDNEPPPYSDKTYPPFKSNDAAFGTYAIKG